MDEPSKRLQTARLRAGFTTAKEAAEAMGVPVPTYLSHENGSRGISAKRAAQYARRFKVAEQWLLYGVGKAPGTEDTSASAEVVNIWDRLSGPKRDEALKILRILAGGEG